MTINSVTTAPAGPSTKAHPHKHNVTHNAAAREAISKLKEAATLKAEAERLKEEGEAILKAITAEPYAEFIVNGVVACKVSSPRVHRHADLTLLHNTFPEAYDATLRESHYTFYTAS